MNIAAIACVLWPIMPKSWRAQELIDWIFQASKDPSMGIQYMFYWLYTVILGGVLSYGGTIIATKSSNWAIVSSMLLVFGGVYIMYLVAN